MPTQKPPFTNLLPGHVE